MHYLFGGPCDSHNQPRVYLAAPIFTPEQLAAVEHVAELAHRCGYVTYSPSRDGIMLAPTDGAEKRDDVFDSNVRAIRASDLLIALLDVKDTGTTWELGVATGIDIPIVAVTLDVPKMNVMLERGVVAHVRNHHDLEDVLITLRPFLVYGVKSTAPLRAAQVSELASFKDYYSYSGETQ